MKCSDVDFGSIGSFQVRRFFLFCQTVLSNSFASKFVKLWYICEMKNQTRCCTSTWWVGQQLDARVSKVHIKTSNIGKIPMEDLFVYWLRYDDWVATQYFINFHYAF